MHVDFPYMHDVHIRLKDARASEGDDMDIEQLRQLQAVADRGTVSAAAESLRISQPALSRSLARLERELGCTLLDRSGRRIALNHAGKTALEYARSILHEERLMRIALSDLANRARSLTVGTVAPAPLWRLTALSVERFPERMLSSRTMRQQDVEREVIDRGLDLGISRKPLHYPAVRCCRLMDEDLAVSVPNGHPLASRDSLTFADVDGEDFLLFGNIGFWRGLVDEKMPHSDFLVQEDRVVFEQLSLTSPLLGFVTNAAYLAGEMPGRTVVPLEDAEAHASFYLLAHREASRQALELFDWVEAHANAKEDGEHHGKES